MLEGNTSVFLWLMDLLLALAALTLAIFSLHGAGGKDAEPWRAQRRRIIYFMSFGVMLALIWARLGAPDVAIAEAVIGAGFAGALLLTALRDGEPVDKGIAPTAVNSVVSGLSLLLGVLIALSLWHWLQPAPASNAFGLSESVAAALPETGVANPVTAVLLNLRAYDTLLELAVLLAAALGITALGQSRPAPARAGLVLVGLLHWIVPALFLVAGYLLWVGASAPGGAFQAGALLAAAGVMVHLGGTDRGGLPAPRVQAWVSVSGIAVFLLVGLGTLWMGEAFLGYRGDRAAALILLIEGFATISIGTLLVQAYLGGLARGDGFAQSESHHVHRPKGARS